MPRKKTDWQAEWQRVAKEYRTLAKRANQRMVRIERYSQEREKLKNLKKYAYAGAQREIQTLYHKEGDKLRYTETPRLLEFKKDGRILEGDEKIKANIMALKAKEASINKFLGAVTSTIGDIKGPNIDPETGKKEVLKSGYLSSDDKRAASLNKRLKETYDFDANLTGEDLQRFFNSRKQKKLEGLVGSDQMFVVASTMKKKRLASNKRELQKFFKENIDLNDLKEAGISINEKDYKNAGEYFEKLSEFIELTGNEILDDYVKKAIKEGINYKNLFI